MARRGAAVWGWCGGGAVSGRFGTEMRGGLRARVRFKNGAVRGLPRRPTTPPSFRFRLPLYPHQRAMFIDRDEARACNGWWMRHTCPFGFAFVAAPTLPTRVFGFHGQRPAIAAARPGILGSRCARGNCECALRGTVLSIRVIIVQASSPLAPHGRLRLFLGCLLLALPPTQSRIHQPDDKSPRHARLDPTQTSHINE